MDTVKHRYQTIEFKNFDIHLKTLKNKQQFSDDEDEAKDLGINDTLWPIFGVLWPASLILARLMDDYSVDEKSILEVGCGISLSSLVLNKRKANITATDYHPESQNFLAENVKLNQDKSINFFLADWATGNPNLGNFDLIIGSDLLYEDTHPKLLANFINQHANKSSEIVLVFPERGYQKEFNVEMESYKFHHEKIDINSSNNDEDSFDGFIHKYTRSA